MSSHFLFFTLKFNYKLLLCVVLLSNFLYFLLLFISFKSLNHWIPFHSNPFLTISSSLFFKFSLKMSWICLNSLSFHYITWTSSQSSQSNLNLVVFSLIDSSSLPKIPFITTVKEKFNFLNSLFLGVLQ